MRIIYPSNNPSRYHQEIKTDVEKNAKNRNSKVFLNLSIVSSGGSEKLKLLDRNFGVIRGNDRYALHSSTEILSLVQF